MHRQLLMLCMLAPIAGGCSIWNSPDRDLLVDGGVDSSMDSMVDGDTGLDGDTGPDGDVGPDACPSPVEICGNGMDDDCDTLIDCADLDCASRMECCEVGAITTTSWTPENVIGLFDNLPTDGPVEPRTTGGNIIDFPAGSQGILTTNCVPLAAGYQAQIGFTLGESCTDPRGCFAAIVITPAPGAMPGARIEDDVGVTVEAGGDVVVTNAGIELARENFLTVAGQRVEITILVTIGVDEDDEPGVLATVRASGAGRIEELLTGHSFAAPQNLYGAPLCPDIAGMRLAIEGTGDLFTIDSLIETPLECVNAGRFSEPDDDPEWLTHDWAESTGNLRWGEWSSGGIGSPSLAVQEMSETAWVWHLMGDGTNGERAAGPAAEELGFSLGHSSVFNNQWRMTWETRSNANPKLGNCNPGCELLEPMSCPTATPGSEVCPDNGAPDDSVVDPSLGVLPVVPGAGVITYAARIAEDTFGIAIDPGFLIGGNRQGVTAPAFLPQPMGTVAPFDMCDSLRDPVLAPVDPEDMTRGYWLFYSCYTAVDDTAADVADIHVVKIGEDLLDPMPVPATHQVVVPRSIGSWASTSVWSPELVVEYEPGAMGQGRHLYRLWFLARSGRRNEVNIGLLQGQLDAVQSAAGDLPTFAPFGGNPIYNSTRDQLDDCDSCDIKGFAVVRVPGPTNRIRFLFSRLANEGRDDDWHYAPFEQFWRRPTWM